jgi:pimeloyl-ACP methyl ester carboxylesterase
MREKYIKATATLSNLELKYGYKTNDIKKILRKSPHMGLRDGMMFMQTDKLTARLVGDVERTYDIQDVIEYQVPIFYILGRHDAWTSSTVAAEYFEIISAPQKGLFWIEDAGHMVDTDNPSAFWKAIEEIISQQ